MAIQPTPKDLVEYWRLFARLEQLNGLHQKANQLDCVPIDIKDGRLTNLGDSQSSDQPLEFLISPCSFEYQQTLIMPIWVMVQVDLQGNLGLHPTIKVPFIPKIYSDARGLFGELFGKREIIEVTINQMFNSQMHQEEVTWQAYLNKIKDLFETLNPTLFQLNKENFKVYQLEAPNQVEVLEGIAKQFLEMPALEHHQNRPSPSLSSGFIAISNQEKLTLNFLETALKTLDLPENSFQTIEAPLASARQDWLESMVLSLSARQFGKTQPLSLAIVSSDPLTPLWEGAENWLPQANALMEKSFKRQEEALEALVSRWQKEMTMLDKASKAFETNVDKVQSKVDKCKSQLLTSQLKDEKFEEKYERFAKALQDWQVFSKRSWLAKLWQKLVGGNHDAMVAEFLANHNISLKWDKSKSLEDNLIETMRAIKVKRTKLHRQLMVLTSDLAELESLQQVQKDCLEQYPQLKALEGVEAFKALLENTGQRASSILKCLLKSQTMPVHITYLTPQQAEKLVKPVHDFDWVFFLNGESLSPIAMFKLLGYTKRAVILGDSKISRSTEISIDFDSHLVMQLNLCEYEEELDDLLYMGHLMSQSSLYQLASAYSVYQSTDQTGLVRLPTLELTDLYLAEPFKDYFKNHLKVKSSIHALPGLLSFMATEPEFSTSQGWLNPNEAKQLVNALNKEDTETVIVTLSMAQKSLIEILLSEKGLGNRVVLLDHAYQAKRILFSPVYAASAPRPHVLDCGDGPIYKLMSLTRELMIYADGQLLNTKTHSPTGDLAKLLEQQTQIQENASL